MAPLRKLLLAVTCLTVAVEGFALPSLGDVAARELATAEDWVLDKRNLAVSALQSRSHGKHDDKDQHAASSGQSTSHDDDHKGDKHSSGSDKDGSKSGKHSSGSDKDGSKSGKHHAGASDHHDHKKSKPSKSKDEHQHHGSKSGGHEKHKGKGGGGKHHEGKKHGGTDHKKGHKKVVDAAPTTSLWDADFGPYFADPALIQDGEYWYAFSTQSCESKMAIARSKSRDAKSWHLVPGEHLPGADTVWGPDIRKQGSAYLLMYSDGSSLYTAASDTVAGSFGGAAPLIKADGTNYIDGAFFQDTDGSLHVVYKRSKYDSSTHQHVWSQIEIRALDASGRSTVGAPRILAKATAADGDHNIEAPYLVHDQSHYYLTFSTHEYAGPAYNTQYVAATSIDDLAKATRHTLLSSATKVGDRHLDGPGGLTFAAGDASSGAVAFHNREDPYGKGAGNCAKNQNGLHRKLWLGNVHLDSGTITIT